LINIPTVLPADHGVLVARCGSAVKR